MVIAGSFWTSLISVWAARLRRWIAFQSCRRRLARFDLLSRGSSTWLIIVPRTQNSHPSFGEQPKEDWRRYQCYDKRSHLNGMPLKSTTRDVMAFLPRRASCGRIERDRSESNCQMYLSRIAFRQ